MERTFVMVKPDGVHRGLVGEVLKRFEQKGLKLVAAKFLKPSVELVEKHYSEHVNKPFFSGLVDFVSQGPVFATIWEGPNAIKIGRLLLGATNPAESLAGTIRGDLAVVMARNLVHASSCPEDAEKECQLWFNPDELVDWVPTVFTWALE